MRNLACVLAVLISLPACGDDETGPGSGGGGGGTTSSTSTDGTTSSTDSSSATTTGTGGGGLCPDGLGDTEQTEPDITDCADGEREGEACCSLDEVYCVFYELPDGGGNIFTKILFTCEGETFGAGVELDQCPGDTFEDLDALDGTPCDGDAPCEITTGDGDDRVGICFEGTWFVYGNGG